MKKIFITFILLLNLTNCPAHAQKLFEVADIRVEGLLQISPETVFSYLPVGVGDEIDEEKYQSIVSQLKCIISFNDKQTLYANGIINQLLGY